MVSILHIDTSGENSLIALSQDGILQGVITNNDARNHASILNTHIEQLMAKHSMLLQDIDAFSVCGGPGSYTGLRIGLAATKGFCYALDKPLLQHNKLQLIANNYLSDYPDSSTFISILQAREKEYFAAIYNRKLISLKQPQHLHESDLQAFVAEENDNIICAGYINEDVRTAFHNQSIAFIDDMTINTDKWAAYTYQQYLCNDFVNMATAEPFYLKQVYTHKKKNIN